MSNGLSIPCRAISGPPTPISRTPDGARTYGRQVHAPFLLWLASLSEHAAAVLGVSPHRRRKAGDTLQHGVRALLSLQSQYQPLTADGSLTGIQPAYGHRGR